MSDLKYTGNNKKHTKLSTTIDYTPYYNPVSYQKIDALSSKIEKLYLDYNIVFSFVEKLYLDCNIVLICQNFTISDRNHFHYIFIFNPFL
jgi:hypothetical protein